jgi:predicted transcriptional regulator
MTEKLARRGLHVPRAYLPDALSHARVVGVMRTNVASNGGAADLSVLSPRDSLLTALTRMVDEDVEELPVADNGHIVGVLTRADVMDAAGKATRDESLQHGWLASHVLGRRRNPVN